MDRLQQALESKGSASERLQEELEAKTVLIAQLEVALTGHQQATDNSQSKIQDLVERVGEMETVKRALEEQVTKFKL